MKEKNDELRICPYCGKEFYPERHNQRFDDPVCRVAYHNDINNELRRARYFVDKKLHKNYIILLELMKGKIKEVFHKQFLIGKGYSFDVMTHYVVLEEIKRQAMYDFIIISDALQVTILRIKK